MYAVKDMNNEVQVETLSDTARGAAGKWLLGRHGGERNLGSDDEVEVLFRERARAAGIALCSVRLAIKEVVDASLIGSRAKAA